MAHRVTQRLGSSICSHALLKRTARFLPANAPHNRAERAPLCSAEGIPGTARRTEHRSPGPAGDSPAHPGAPRTDPSAPRPGPAFLVSAVKGFKEVQHPAGRLSVSADRRSSALWLARPRLGDAAVYYCALVARGEEPGLRPGTNRFGRGGGTVPSGPAGGAACRAAKLHRDQGAPP